MGDYVDRGYFSLNTFLFLASYKIERPAAFFLLRDNHETRQMTDDSTEVLGLYGHVGIWQLCMRVFDLLPIAAIVDADVFSVHGGLSPKLVLCEDLLAKDRQKEIAEKGMIADLTWSDLDGTPDLQWRPNARGAGFVFGAVVVKRFCHRNRLRLITRSHQLVMAEFQWYYEDQGSLGRLVNVWSAPNYQYQSGNSGSVLKLRFERGSNEAEYQTVVFNAEVQERRIDKERTRSNPSSYFS
jgi:diadenosine tetraphosphatase ApaH/serine/threonine PP2A family protein phosphatase